MLEALMAIGGSLIWLVIGIAFIVAFVLVGKSIYSMMHIASRNLIQRKSMTALALIGLILGVATIITLVSVSTGIQGMVTERTAETKGIMVLEKDTAFGPIFSVIDMDDIKKIENIAGVRNVCPRIIHLAKSIEGEFIEVGMGISGQVLGADPAREARKRSGPLTTAGDVTRGRFLSPSDTKAVVIGGEIAEKYNKAIGSTMKVDGEKFKVVGIAETGNPETENLIIMPIDEARELEGLEAGKVRVAFVEVDDTNQLSRIADLIEAKVNTVQAISTEDFAALIGGLLSSVEAFLWAISAIAGIVAGVNIINTMLMSIMEREQELGIMRAIGWTQDDIITLVMAESVLLGLAGGVMGVIAGIGIVEVAKTLLDIPMLVDLPLAINAILFALAVGSLGGIYPAWKASRMNPLEAIQGE